MPDKDNNILKYNSGENPMKVPFVICVYLKILVLDIRTLINNQQLK